MARRGTLTEQCLSNFFEGFQEYMTTGRNAHQQHLDKKGTDMERHKNRIDNIFTMVHEWVEKNPEDFCMLTWHKQTYCGTTMCIGGKILYECDYTPEEINDLGGEDEKAPALRILVDIIRNSGYPEFTLWNSIALFRQTGELRAKTILKDMARHEADRAAFAKPYLRFSDRLEITRHGMD